MGPGDRGRLALFFAKAVWRVTCHQHLTNQTGHTSILIEQKIAAQEIQLLSSWRARLRIHQCLIFSIALVPNSTICPMSALRQ
jgi:hypothetical protein